MSGAALYLLGAINLAVGLYSLITALGSRSYLRRSGAREELFPSELPPVALLVPCCGLEHGLEENLRALFHQHYPDLELVFIVESESDTALPIIRTVMESERCPSSLVIAGPAEAGGQKIHNLMAGLAHVGDKEVLAFADSDIRPSRDWLKHLVAPLERSEVGVATGYRFYVPEPSFASILRSAWNAGVLTILGDHDHNFAWGGSMAIRRKVFREAEVERSWRGALSDDYALTHTVRNAGYRVEFVPSCIVATIGKTTLAEVFRWCYRQMAITRVYWRNLWRIAGGSQVVYCAFLLAATVAALGGDLAAGILLASVLLLGVASVAIRIRAIGALSPEWKKRLRRYTASYALMVPLVGFLTAYGFIRSALSQRIAWRGKVYEMRSPNETILLRSYITPAKREAPDQEMR